MKKKITFDNYNWELTPNDVREYAEQYGGICGQASIASLFHITVKEVFDKWGIKMSEFKGFTPEKEMRVILNKFGYTVKRRNVKDKYSIPECDFGIIRVSFGKPTEHWAKIARESHYLAVVKYIQGRYIYDNAIDLWDGKPINGVWIHEKEYPKWMKAHNMFVTSYLDLTKKEHIP